MMEVLAKIEELTGTSTNKEYTQTHTDLRILIIPASNESVAFFSEMPSGQPYQFTIISDTVPNLKEQSRITVTDAQVSDFTVNDVFITIGDTKRTRLGGKFYLTGMCYLKQS